MAIDLWRGDRNRPSAWGQFDPFRDFEQMFEDMNRMMQPMRSSQGDFLSPACDIEEIEDKYLLSFDMPGIDSNDIDIEATGNQITVTAERRREEQEEGRSTAHRTERYYGRFRRTFSLPEGIDPSLVEASYENGVLHVVIPKAQAAGAQKIKIGESKGGFLKNILHRAKEKTVDTSAEQKGTTEQAS